ncbi:SEL1-like repeat protein [Akkermansia sp. N21169]|uniref:SEL1-like repeat protein n=1 Tax=Akkermansia sp. N21169 TaxID=3040765 RepID=UPI00244EFF1D|nr:SEL1-like repeat protein [Akkermansia sp. N21169]MDH3068156.1 SEL1-like repeat protein [Akkermansia sp. N21169]
MNRKMIITVFALLLAVLAGVGLWWTSSPEYGDSYSEQQRKLWNERRALYPMAWTFCRLTPVNDDYLAAISSLDKARLDEVLEKKGEQELILKQQQRSLCEKEKPPCDLLVGIPDDISSLRVDCMTVRECLQRAQGGDADACLVMAWHQICFNYWRDYGYVSKYGWSWRQARDMDFWLAKAESLGRPGTQFLRHFSAMMAKEIRKNLDIAPGNGFLVWSNRCPDYKYLPGYNEFSQCLQNGDLMVYRLMRGMLGSFKMPDLEESRIREVLRSRAKTGDVTSMENIASLLFDCSLYAQRENVCEDLKQSWGMRVVGAFPETMQNNVRVLLMDIGLIDADSTKAMKEFREATEYARMAAKQGSLMGMDYWLQCGQWCMNFWTREDWEDVFRYDRILRERGYAPYLYGRDYYPSPRRFDGEMMASYYSASVLDDACTRAIKSLKVRGDVSVDVLNLTHGTTPDSAIRELDDILMVHGSDAVLNQMLLHRHYWKASPEVAAIYAEKVKEWADEGDPLAWLVLGKLYEEGRWVTRDLGKAWSCYGKVKKNLGPFGIKPISFWDPEDKNKYISSWLERMGIVMQASMIVRYPDFPGRDEEVATAFALNMSDKHLSKTDGLICYILGRIYEDGIGVPPDRKKALEYYARGSSYADSSDGYDRLQKSQAKSE